MEAEGVGAASEVTAAADLGVAERPALVRAARPSQASPAQRVAPAVLALAFAGLAVSGHRSVAGVLIAGFAAVVLVVLAAIDIERRTIPNRIVLPAAAVVLVGRIAEYPHGWVEFVLASLGAAALLFLPSVFNRAAIGMGDVKLGLLLGAALGWKALDAIVIALLFAAPVSATILIRGRRAARGATIPLAPFFAVGALVAVVIMPPL
jgi:leader peptidase (prepilin peptidase)/N-methyltransferase